MFQKCHYRHVIDEKYKQNKQNSSSQWHFVYMEPVTWHKFHLCNQYFLSYYDDNDFFETKSRTKNRAYDMTWHEFFTKSDPCKSLIITFLKQFWRYATKVF